MPVPIPTYIYIHISIYIYIHIYIYVIYVIVSMYSICVQIYGKISERWLPGPGACASPVGDPGNGETNEHNRQTLSQSDQMEISIVVVDPLAGWLISWEIHLKLQKSMT
jgi:hypothetical protein